jgi:hypothetical protein
MYRQRIMKKRLLGLVFMIAVLLASCGQFPGDNSAIDDANTQQEINQGRIEAATGQADYLNYLADQSQYTPVSTIWPTVVRAFIPIHTVTPDPAINDYYSYQATVPASACTFGCVAHVIGCDIKRNISFNTNEKIYQMPGQKYYATTVIDPAYGERWFCTEKEAIANGWRKSEQ